MEGMSLVLEHGTVAAYSAKYNALVAYQILELFQYSLSACDPVNSSHTQLFTYVMVSSNTFICRGQSWDEIGDLTINMFRTAKMRSGF